MSHKSSMQRNKGVAINHLLENYVMLDIETTGFSPINDRIIELAALKVVNNNVVDTFQTLVDPQCEISPHITGLTGIDNSMVDNKPCIEGVLPSFIDFVGENIILGHNVSFDINFIYDNWARHFGMQFSNDYQDTLTISRRLFPNLSSHRLNFLIAQFNIVNESAHRALSDCYATYELYNYIQKYMMVKDIDLQMVLNSRIKRRSKPKKPIGKMGTAVQDFDTDNPLYNKTVVFTGTMDCLVRSDAIQLVLDNGGICPTTVTRGTDILVLGNGSYNAYKTREIKSIKIKKAEANIAKGKELAIISEQTFISYFNESTKSNIYSNEYIIDTTSA